MADLFRKDSKEKNEKVVFDMETLLSTISPLKSKPKLQKQQSSTSDSFLDITQEAKTQKAVLSASAKRLIEKANTSFEHRSSDVIRAKKEFEKGLKDVEMKSRQNALKDTKNREKSSQSQSSKKPAKDQNNKKQEKISLPKKPPSRELIAVIAELKKMNRDYDKIKNDPKKLKEFNDLLAKKKHLEAKGNKEESDSSSSDSSSDSSSERKKIVKKSIPQPKKKEPTREVPKQNADKKPQASSSKIPSVESKSKKNIEYNPLGDMKENRGSQKASQSIPESSKGKVEYDPLDGNTKSSDKKDKNIEKKQKIEVYEKPIEKKIKHDKQYEKIEKNDSKPKKTSNPRDPFEDDEEDAQRMLDKILGGYRRKVANSRYDDDDSVDMEAGFDEIEEEDLRSRRIGAIEDQIEYERMKKKHKKKKHSHK